MSKKNGFSLLELIIVIAIIGTLAVVITPLYKDHVKKSKVHEARVLFANFKKEAEKYLDKTGHYPASLSVLSDFTTKGHYVTKIDYTQGDNPLVVMTLEQFKPPVNTIAWKWLTPEDKPGRWSCKHNDTGATTIKVKYLPKACLPE